MQFWHSLDEHNDFTHRCLRRVFELTIDAIVHECLTESVERVLETERLSV